MLIRDKLLSKRLAAIYDLIEDHDSVADIGTDHGYLLVALASDKKSSRVYGVDNKSAPLSQAKKTIAEAGLQDSVELTLVKQDHAYHHVDVWVIAGMGYVSIASIINEFMDTIQRLKYVIVQVNHQIEEFRVFCMKNNLEIIDEVIIYDGHYYQILKIKHQPCPISYTEEELLLGPILIKNKVPTFFNYCEHKIVQLKKIQQKLAENDEKRKRIETQIHYYQNQLEE